MTSRREFLTAMPALGAVAAQSVQTVHAEPGANAASFSGQSIELEHGWSFFLDRTGIALPGGLPANAMWRPVSIPHTWQALGGEPDYVGVAWYRTTIHAPAAWQQQFVRIEFEAVYHTAHVYLNGVPVGTHAGMGYTAFQFDLTPKLKWGEPNELLVRVDNSYSDTMLPRGKSFDWANDGGLTRPVHLLVTPPVFIDRIQIDAAPNLEKGTAEVKVAVELRNMLPDATEVRLEGVIRRLGACEEPIALPHISLHMPVHSVAVASLVSVTLHSPALWHFDAPNLYEAEVNVSAGEHAHSFADTFGIRKFEARGAAFYLNGERVRLMGVERMAGSHPQFGMAEPTEWIEANHREMKELNCVFTRVHWPQDRRVLDFCDRHGILMQTEVPAWGPDTFDKTSDEVQRQLEINGYQQLAEMIARDRNHPCIVSWGLCNEVNGKNPRTRAFATKLAHQARKLDPSRLLTYASNSLGEHPEADMAGEFDFISANEYFGSWAPGGPPELRAHLEALRKAFPNKPIVISEYGWCECQASIPPGDEHRIEIINNHTDVLRDFPEVAGAIYFDYNDYRTIVGDHGQGALRQRVHGVVDLYANRKLSFEALRRQASPIQELGFARTAEGLQLRIAVRNTLPSYTLHGYQARWLFFGYDDLPMEGRLDELPVLEPGARFTIDAKGTFDGLRSAVVDVLSPTGFSVATVRNVVA